MYILLKNDLYLAVTLKPPCCFVRTLHEGSGLQSCCGVLEPSRWADSERLSLCRKNWIPQVRLPGKLSVQTRAALCYECRCCCKIVRKRRKFDTLEVTDLRRSRSCNRASCDAGDSARNLSTAVCPTVDAWYCLLSSPVRASFTALHLCLKRRLAAVRRLS